MLIIEDLSVSYGSRRVLHKVSLNVSAGEVLAMIGPNGAGKTTLVRAVSGVIPVQDGKVRADGNDLLTMTPMRRARYLAVVPQSVSLPPAFTVWETVLLGRTPYLNFLGQVSTKDEEIARLALQKVDALKLIERRVGELSGGEQQRVLLARALAQSTPILILDEPTVHLDLQYQINLMEIIRCLAHADNLAVLIALHDLNLAARYADRVALLVAGEVKATGTAWQVLTPEIISLAYHLPVQVIPHPFADIPLVLPDSPID
ncbi:MAG: ABC transporter ATP-binding protein [Anaerolineales bacterium]|jgi:iron complex transport system ATP-binding protein